MQRCDWCQRKVTFAISVVNRSSDNPGEYELLCSDCSEVERFEHVDELLWNPVTYQLLTEGLYNRLRSVSASNNLRDVA